MSQVGHESKGVNACYFKVVFGLDYDCSYCWDDLTLLGCLSCLFMFVVAGLFVILAFCWSIADCLFVFAWLLDVFAGWLYFAVCFLLDPLLVCF